MGVITGQSYKMHDLSRSTVEYVCKNVTSPNIARRFGHKLIEDKADTWETQKSSLSPPSRPSRRQTRSPSSLHQFESSKASMPVYQSRQKPAIESNFYKPSPQDGENLTNGSQYTSVAHGANPENKDLTKKVNSWMKDPKRGILPSMNIKNSLSNVPRIFIYHQSTLTKYFKSWH